MHADAYRLGGIAELDDLDLDASLDDAVTVVEWGEGMAEALADNRLEVRLDRLLGDGSSAGAAALAAAGPRRSDGAAAAAGPADPETRVVASEPSGRAGSVRRCARRCSRRLVVVLLALDTATAAVTVAIADGAAVVAERTLVDPLRHGELLAPSIAELLESAGLSVDAIGRIAVGVGPGPFTGLRVGLVTARTMAAVLGVPLHGVCTLDVIAAAVQVGSPFVVATDARRNEVYIGGVRRVRPPNRTAGRRAASGGRHRPSGCGARGDPLSRQLPATDRARVPVGCRPRPPRRLRAAPRCCRPSRSTSVVPMSLRPTAPKRVS